MKSAVCCAGHGHPALIRSDGPDRPVTVLIPGVSNNPDLLVNLKLRFFSISEMDQDSCCDGVILPQTPTFTSF